MTGNSVQTDSMDVGRQMQGALARPNMEAFAAAYVAAWAEMPHVVKNSNNPHLGNDYADLAAMLDTIRPVFGKYGLALFQSPSRLSADADRVEVVSVLWHKSGQHVQITAEMLCAGPVKKDGTQLPPTAQTIGSAITYVKRYVAQAMAGIASVDDDGNAAAGRAVEEPAGTDNEKLQSEIEGFTGSLEDFKKAFHDRAAATGDNDFVKNVYMKKRAEIKAVATKA